MVAVQRISPHNEADSTVPPGYESWREARWLDIAGPNGKARIVGNGRVLDCDTHTSGRTLEFSDGRTGVVGGSTGAYSFVLFDPAAFSTSGISRIDCYPYDPAWVPFDLAVTLADGEHVLTALEDSPGCRRVIFTDETSGTQTPGIGRWLTLPVTEPGQKLPLDFNQVTLSYHHVNPSLFHCPVPPPGNHLPIRIEAGEHTLVFGQGAPA